MQREIFKISSFASPSPEYWTEVFAILVICDSHRGCAIRLDRCVFTLYYWPLGLVKQNMNRGSISSLFAVKMIQRLCSSECRTEIPIQMGHGSNSRSAYVYKFHLASGVRRLAFKYGHILPRECKRANHPWHRFIFNRPFCSFLSWHRALLVLMSPSLIRISTRMENMLFM